MADRLRAKLVETGLVRVQRYLQDALPPCHVKVVALDHPDAAADRLRRTRSIQIELRGSQRLSFSMEVLQHLATQHRKRALRLLQAFGNKAKPFYRSPGIPAKCDCAYYR